MAVRTEGSEVRTKATEGQYFPERLELTRLVSSLLYGTRTTLVLSLPAFENKKYTADDRFHRNGPYGEILTKKEPIRTLGFTLPYNNTFYFIADVQLERCYTLNCKVSGSVLNSVHVMLSSSTFCYSLECNDEQHRRW